MDGGRGMLQTRLVAIVSMQFRWSRQVSNIMQQKLPLIGAIRWDAWHGDRGVPGKAVQQALSPERYHWRLPFFAEVKGPDRVVIDGASQEVMDREIEYAAGAGIDYWAFVTYDEHNPMSLGLAHYLQSAKRELVNFCLVTEAGRWSRPEFIERIVGLLREPGYQTVLDGRPLLYLGFLKHEQVEKDWGGAEGLRRVIDDLRSTVREHGVGDPYLVIMDFIPEWGKHWADQLGGDAISSYVAPRKMETHQPYAYQTAADRAFWEQCRATGMPVVPVITAGWDRRPRIEYPMPWERWQQPGAGIERYIEAATPRELADHVQEALEWLAQYRDAAPAQAAIIYAWNENDEGGWIVPTLHDGSARLDAIGAVLQARKEP